MDTKELKRLAIQAQCAPGTNSELEQFQQEYYDALDTQTVLALIARITELEAAAGAPDLRSAIEAAAKAMALSVGWDKWDTATDFTHTHSGNDPAEERDYFRGLARAALASAAPVEEAALTDEEILRIAAKNELGWGGAGSAVAPFSVTDQDAEPYISFARAIEARIKGGVE
ncbi:hypothetical protein HF313_14915 [Massilia atriviolacea]|uniref:Uncharacterized protein n=1 Tax=Massilia atriviolacea TaxID=2495579 RepID=A0A430HR61_9BURK|nr:hypothetical protein [Massilia atriviolacea]RSZ60004.1 hypothetical protein EJB06_07440 [Massilia atriviolacea]